MELKSSLKVAFVCPRCWTLNPRRMMFPFPKGDDDGSRFVAEIIFSDHPAAEHKVLFRVSGRYGWNSPFSE